MKKDTLKLITLLGSFILLWILAAAFSLQIFWFITVNLSALYIIWRYKDFNIQDIVIGVLFGILCIPSNIIMGISVILPYISARMIFRTSENKIVLFDNQRKRNGIITIVSIFVIGGILGCINILLAMGSMSIHLSFKLKWILDALRAGIFEEIFFRFFFFALCMHLVKTTSLSKIQNILCYAIMIIPHVLIHFNLQNFNTGSVITLSLLFGLPFALMQRKFNLLSAIGSHAFVDVLRFCVLGV